ncbi:MULTISPECIES: porin [Corallincola]|uniref:Porin n=3 Tax=Corallincola TaxID=1775176 RepID=A0A368NGU3_9GAMM|nr:MULTISPECIES: porin [Corallincola]RCU49103.1 porin [Corallincola holothuriorum]TAA47585.1 porin [Corallincola spongiicola]TCI05267.1 porin [Corallincola luteus]
MKHFAKTVVAASLTMAFAAPAFAVAPVTVYGKANVSIQAADDKGTDGSEMEVKSNASRFGIKGGVELMDDLQAIYKYEFQINLTDDNAGNSSDDNLKSRNQYVGLKGFFGEAVIGRNDTMLKQSQGKVDVFGDLEGDIKTLFQGENREGDTISYKTPKFNDFQLGFTVVSEDNSAQEDDNGDTNFGFSSAITYGDKKLKKSDLYAGLAMDSQVDGGWDIIRATVGYKWEDLKLGFIVQNQEQDKDWGGNGEDQTGFMLSAAYTIDAWTLKAQYQTMEDADGAGKYSEGNDASAISVGADYKLGKPTKVYAYYTMRDWDDAEYENAGGDMEDDESYFGIGLEHKF